MRKIDYPRLYGWSVSHSKLIGIMRDMHIPAVVFVILSYAAHVGFSAYLGSIPRAATLVAVSAVPFILVSALRAVISAPRPYEVYDLESIGLTRPRHKGGNSFPSRHVFSAFLVGTLILPDVPALGAVVLVLGVYIAAYRVLVGAHFIRDAVVGAAIGVATGVAGALCVYFFC